jgi:hypothetical protein
MLSLGRGGVYSEWESLPTQEAAEARVNMQRYLVSQHLS